MKTYDNLTKKEKEKIRIFWQIKGNLRLRATIMILAGYIGIFLGFPLMLSRSTYALFAGTVLVLMGLIVSTITYQQIGRDDKYLKLAFGIDDAMEDIFEIKKTDIKGMKKVWIKK